MIVRVHPVFHVITSSEEEKNKKKKTRFESLLSKKRTCEQTLSKSEVVKMKKVEYII